VSFGDLILEVRVVRRFAISFPGVRRLCLLVGVVAVALGLGGASVEAAQPGKNGMIVFWRGIGGSAEAYLDLHVVNPDGSGLQELLRGGGNGQGRALQPEWSPDGNEIVFIRNQGSCCELWRVKADGTGAVRLLPNESQILNPTWSPDGTQIAYKKFDLSNAAGGEIRVTDRDGKRSKRIFIECKQYGNGAIGDVLTWGANNKIAFEAAFCSDPADWWLATMNPDGGGLTRVRLTRGSNRVKVDQLTPRTLDWSPDKEGAKLLMVAATEQAVFTCGGSYGYFPADVYVLDPSDPDNPVNLTNTRGNFGFRELEAAWSPDGEQIVLSRVKRECNKGKEVQGQPELWTMSKNGGNLKKLTQAKAADGRVDPGSGLQTNDNDPSWQPCITGKTLRCSTGGTQPNPTPAAGCAGVKAADVKPVRLAAKPLAGFPNNTSACRAVWVPMLKPGFAPQGLALAGDGSALVSGHYEPGDRCLVVAVDLATGQPGLSRTIPQCKHAGGIAIDDSGRAWVAGTDTLLPLKPGFLTQSGGSPIAAGGPIALTEPLNGSFLAGGRGGRLWIGDYNDDTLYQFKISDLLAKRTITVEDALSSIQTTASGTLGPQGADFHPTVKLWTTFSFSDCGVLAVGTANPTWYGFGPGAEGIAFAPNGKLWAIFEAGSSAFPKAPYFPVIAEFDTAKLQKLHQPPVGRCAKQ
jgi:Tol biopolymer transport system component